MVLCPDVFEANWDSTKQIAEVCEGAIKEATVTYEKVPLVLCVLSGLMILVCVCVLAFVWYVGLHVFVSPHIYVCMCKVMKTADASGGPSQCKRRLLVEMEDRFLSAMSSA